jgi:hypothetical protein
MQILDDSAILMVEPSGGGAKEPLVDELTRKMTAAGRKRRDAESGYRGVHRCACGACSSNRDHWVTRADGSEFLTNSLCIHYVAYHREELSEEELAKVLALTHGEMEPTQDELFNNPFKR